MSGAIRSKLQENAVKAEKMLEKMLPVLQKLREARANELCASEVARLKNENAELRKQIDSLVTTLDKTESNAGARQYPRPKKESRSTSTVVAEEPTPEPANKETPPAEKKKKEKKPAAGGKKTASNPDDDKPLDVTRLLLKVGKIVEVKKHPDADTLYVETVDLAEEAPRTIVSGLVRHHTLEQMQDKVAVFACNLKPAKMRGILSSGMIMCASTAEKCQIIDVPSGAAPGDIITFPGYSGEPDAQLNPKKKIWEAVQPDLSTNAEGVACYKGAPFTIEGKGVCIAPGCNNFPIK